MQQKTAEICEKIIYAQGTLRIFYFSRWTDSANRARCKSWDGLASDKKQDPFVMCLWFLARSKTHHKRVFYWGRIMFELSTKIKKIAIKIALSASFRSERKSRLARLYEIGLITGSEFEGLIIENGLRGE